MKQSGRRCTFANKMCLENYLKRVKDVTDVK